MQPITQPVIGTKVNAPFGGKIKTMLNAAGIPAAEVVRKQHDTIYTASFFNPEMQTPTKPAKVWAEEITSRFSGITVIEKVDIKAPWREGAPVIEAMVQFRGIPKEVTVVNVGAETTQPQQYPLMIRECTAIVLYTGGQ